MKNTYLQPSVTEIVAKPLSIVCGSQDITSDKGIDYGGVDEEGTKDPSARRYRGVWDDDEEEEYE